jgi:hypothetical protein
VSDVRVYLGGRCSSLTTAVGADDEEGGAGTVTFTVLADGKAVASTPVMRGGQAAATLTAGVAGAQVLDLVVGDGGDGNGKDHGDWATPVLTCS